MSETIRYEKHGNVRLITIDQIEKMNALDFHANDELIERWIEFDQDDDARVADTLAKRGRICRLAVVSTKSTSDSSAAWSNSVMGLELSTVPASFLKMNMKSSK